MAAYIVFETGHTFRPSMLYPVYRPVLDREDRILVSLIYRGILNVSLIHIIACMRYSLRLIPNS